MIATNQARGLDSSNSFVIGRLNATDDYGYNCDTDQNSNLKSSNIGYLDK